MKLKRPKLTGLFYAENLSFESQKVIKTRYCIVFLNLMC